MRSRPPLNAVVRDDEPHRIGGVSGAIRASTGSTEALPLIFSPSLASLSLEEPPFVAPDPILLVPSTASLTLRALIAAADTGGGVFSFLDTIDATQVRGVCKVLLSAVTLFPWSDMRTRITGSLQAWRVCFPRARGASVRGRAELCDADFVYFVGIKSLDMGGVNGISDAAFTHLRGVTRLLMPHCDSPRITEHALDSIAGVRELDVSYCTQLPDSAFKRLAGVHTLIAGGCTQLSDEAFTHFSGIHTLSLFACRQPQLTPKAFQALRGIKELVIFDTRLDLIQAASALLASHRDSLIN